MHFTQLIRAAALTPMLAIPCFGAFAGTEAEPKPVTATTINPAPAAPQATSTSSATTTSATPAEPAAPAVEAEAKPAKPAAPVVTLHADIDLTTQTLTVTSGGKMLHKWPISSGRTGYETPRGTFRPQWAAKMHYSKKYDDAPMPHSVFFNGGVATHATSATGMLGRPASHGCVRLAPSAAATFYGLVHKHGYASTRIVVRGTPKQRGEDMIAQRNPRDRDVRQRELPRQYANRYVPRANGYGPPPGYMYVYGQPDFFGNREMYVVPRQANRPVFRGEARYMPRGYVRY